MIYYNMNYHNKLTSAKTKQLKRKLLIFLSFFLLLVWTKSNRNLLKFTRILKIMYKMVLCTLLALHSSPAFFASIFTRTSYMITLTSVTKRAASLVTIYTISSRCTGCLRKTITIESVENLICDSKNQFKKNDCLSGK